MLYIYGHVCIRDPGGAAAQRTLETSFSDAAARRWRQSIAVSARARRATAQRPLAVNGKALPPCRPMACSSLPTTSSSFDVRCAPRRVRAVSALILSATSASVCSKHCFFEASTWVIGGCSAGASSLPTPSSLAEASSSDVTHRKMLPSVGVVAHRGIRQRVATSAISIARASSTSGLYSPGNAAGASSSAAASTAFASSSAAAPTAAAAAAASAASK